MSQKVQFGVQGPIYPPADRAIEVYQRIEAQGWDFMNMPDQLPSPWPDGLLPEPVSDPDDPTAVVSTIGSVYLGALEMQSAAAAVTTKPGIHVAVIDALRRHPALFAQELATIDHISRGRGLWAIGTGEAKQFTPYGIPHNKPLGRTEEVLRTMRALWESEGKPVTRDSEYYPLKDALFPVPLYNGKRPTIVMVGGGPKVIDITGELADGWLTAAPGRSIDDIATIKDNISRVRAAAERHGRDPDSLQYMIKAQGALAATDEQAWELARSPQLTYTTLNAGMRGREIWEELGFEYPLDLGEKWRWSQDCERLIATDPEVISRIATDVPEKITDTFVIWGGPERVAERLQQYIDAGINSISFNNFGQSANTAMGKDWAASASKCIQLLGHPPLDLG